MATAVFGKPMEFWEQNMPAGMFLRSKWEASQISDPTHALSLDAYQAHLGVPISTPIPLDRFISYGKWFQSKAVPDVDSRYVRRVRRAGTGFRLVLEDGDEVAAGQVVIATGLGEFPARPAQFNDIPARYASHTSEHTDLGVFAGQKVVVIGLGQSAVESAALLQEVGAGVEVIARASTIRWLSGGAWLKSEANPLRALMYPPTDVGPPVLNQIVAAPELFRRLPRPLRDRIEYRSIRPAAAGWLMNRVGGITFTTSRSVTRVSVGDGRVTLILDDGTERKVDHVLLATGYRVDVKHMSILSPEIVSSITTREGYPQLESGFGSSVPGLYFIGAVAVGTFGPLCRFASGSDFTARALTRSIVTRRPASQQAAIRPAA
jgi:thioredoxin reductase